MEDKQVLEKLDLIIELLKKIEDNTEKLNNMIEEQQKKTEEMMDPKHIIKRSIEIQKELQKEISKEPTKDMGQYTWFTEKEKSNKLIRG